MNTRTFTFYFLLFTFHFLSTSLAGQAPWTPPLTPDGKPELQGMWLNQSATPAGAPEGIRRAAAPDR